MIGKQEYRELKIIQNRAEELLLEVIMGRFDEYVRHLDRPDMLDAEENTEYYRGYYEATYDALQRFREIVDEFNDGNRYQL